MRTIGALFLALLVFSCHQGDKMLTEAQVGHALAKPNGWGICNTYNPYNPNFCPKEMSTVVTIPLIVFVLLTSMLGSTILHSKTPF